MLNRNRATNQANVARSDPWWEPVKNECTNCGKECWLDWFICEKCAIQAGIIRPGFNPYD